MYDLATLADLIWLITIILYLRYLDGAFFIGFLWGFRERLSKVGPKGKTLSELFVRCLTTLRVSDLWVGAKADFGELAVDVNCLTIRSTTIRVS